MTSTHQFTIRGLSIVLAVAVLAGCAGQIARQGPGEPGTAAVRDPEQAAAQGDYQRAAELYMQAAGNSSDPARRRQLRFEAGLAAAQAGDADMARQILSSIQPSTLGDLERRRYELARREIDLAGLSPDAALAKLPPPTSGVPAVIAERVWEKRAQLHFKQNALIAGIGDLVQRGVWLVDDDALRANDNRIYERALDAIGYGQGPQSRAARDADKTTRGWLALAAIGQRRFADRDARDAALAAWENDYPQHPASRTVLAERFDYEARTTPVKTRPGQMPRGPAPRPPSDIVALALPTSGRFASAAEAIRDGFMFAYSTSSTSAPQPRIYDTQSLSAADLVRRAQDDNVGILVGPLDKSRVAQMARQQTDIPEVALNYSDLPQTPPGFYQFALAPEDEARAVARRAGDKGYSRALALVPEGGWGSRVLDAFSSAFQANGGQVVNQARYNAETHDHRGPIQSVLQSRSSADFIFVAARPVQGRLIRSQLRFYQAGDLPMLSTSHIYTGSEDRDNDIDLNGVYFVDLPWVIGQGGFLNERRAQAKQQYGDVATRYQRLFAMGIDAWTLTARIAGQGLKPGDLFEGMTGVLRVRPDGDIRRYLAWAVFRNGAPQLLSMPSKREAQAAAGRDAPWAKR